MNAAKKAEKEQEKEQMPDFMKKAEEYFSNNLAALQFTMR